MNVSRSTLNALLAIYVKAAEDLQSSGEIYAMCGTSCGISISISSG